MAQKSKNRQMSVHDPTCNRCGNQETSRRSEAALEVVVMISRLLFLAIWLCSMASVAVAQRRKGAILVQSGGGVEAMMRPRAELEAGSLEKRLAALAAHDAARLAALNTQIENAVVARRSGFASGANFAVNAGPGMFEMEVQIGTPPRAFPLIMDTGSQLVWLQCEPCSKCVAQSTNPLFTPNHSSTYSPLPCSSSECQLLPGQCQPSTSLCRYTYTYASQASTQGQLATDTITFSTSSSSASSHIIFGCGSSNQGDYGGAAGLVGMGQSPLSLPSQLGPSLGGKRFSYCLTSSSSSSTPLLLGAAAPASPPGMLFTPMLANPSIAASLYYLNVADFSLDSRRLNIPAETFSINSLGGGGIILDSGTTYTYLPSAAFDQIRSAFEAAARFEKYTSHPFLPACYIVKESDMSAVPPLTLHLQGADLNLPRDNYFISVDNANNTFCLALIPTSGGLQVVGNILHQNFQVLYDLDTSRIGFLPVDSCATAASR